MPPFVTSYIRNGLCLDWFMYHTFNPITYVWYIVSYSKFQEIFEARGKMPSDLGLPSNFWRHTSNTIIWAWYITLPFIGVFGSGLDSVLSVGLLLVAQPLTHMWLCPRILGAQPHHGYVKLTQKLEEVSPAAPVDRTPLLANKYIISKCCSYTIQYLQHSIYSINVHSNS